MRRIVLGAEDGGIRDGRGAGVAGAAAGGVTLSGRGACATQSQGPPTPEVPCDRLMPGNGKQKRDPRGHVKRDPPVSVNSSVHDLLPWRLFRGCSDLADGLTLAVHIVTCALRSHSRARRVRLSADAPGGVRNRPP